MHMSTQSFNAAIAIGGLVVSLYAFVILAAIGTVIWQGATQEASWPKRVAALGLGLGFWLMGGSFVAGMIGLLLDTFHWLSPAQDKSYRHLGLDATMFSFAMVIGGATIVVLMDGIAVDKKR